MGYCNCAKCGIRFWMPDEFENTMRQFGDKGTFYCPAGHPQHFTFGKTREQIAKDEADRYRREAERERQSRAMWQDEAEAQKRSAAAYKGAATRLKNRAKAGVCPCCNRHFANLEAHMKSKHTEEDLTNVVEFGQKGRA